MLKFPYGKSYVRLDILCRKLLSVVESEFISSAEDEAEEVRRAVKNPIASPPLKNLVHKGDKVVILVSDITRATPNKIVVPPVFETLKEIGVAYDDMEIIIANGLHRPASGREMEELLGREVLENVTVINHRCEDDEHLIDLGKTSFGTNVILNSKAINADFIVGTGLIEPHFFAGDFVKAHKAGVHVLSKPVKIPVSERADIVITTNGGYPLDRNIYQTVKGMATAELIVKKGGVIIIMAECMDGLVHKDFYDLLASVKSLDMLLMKIRENEPLNDQWQAQFLAWILKNAEVILMTRGVKHSYIEDMMMTPASTPEEALELALKKTGKDTKIVAVPEGPFFIPILQ